MLKYLASGKEIARLSEELLQRADAADRWPTPVDDIVEAAVLDEPDEVQDSPFSFAFLSRAPKYLRKAVALIDSGRIRALLDRRERTVHLDPTIEHEGRRSFLRLHEVSHDRFPWQSELAYADDDSTLAWWTGKLFEQEANQGAAELLFQRERFRKMAADYRIGMAAVSELAGTVGASLRATLRRYAESHSACICGVVLEPSPVQLDPLAFRRREITQSAAWTERFGSSWPRVLEMGAFPFLEAIGNPLLGMDGRLTWPDLDCQPVQIHVETVSSRFAVLLLVWVPRREVLKRKRILAGAA
jgi:hypothetical protein